MSALTENAGAVASVSAGVLHDPQQWGPMLDLVCEVTLELPIPRFTVTDLLRLEKGTILDTKWAQGEDVPLRINGELAAWAEFEVVGEKLAIRITEWA